MLRNRHFFTVTALTTLLACSFACAQENSNKTTTPKNQAEPKNTSPQPTQSKSDTSTAISQQDIDRLSEALGHFIGRNLKAPGVNFNLDSLIKGIRDGFAGKVPPMSDQDYENLMIKLQEQTFTQMASNNHKAAVEFLDKNAKANGVIEIEPGKLQYQILEKGQGEAVKEHQTPQIKYSGKFLDGTTFSSSDEVGGAITVPLDQTIPGFSKGILGMKEGEKRRLWVHPDLGYGTSGHLQPNALLIFDIELIKANSAEIPAQESDAESSSDDDLSELDDDSQDLLDDDEDDNDNETMR